MVIGSKATPARGRQAEESLLPLSELMCLGDGEENGGDGGREGKEQQVDQEKEPY